MNVKIGSSVGIGGENNYIDVEVVQTALNQVINLISPTKPLRVDRSLGRNPEKSKTVAAMKVFQKKVVGMVRPDGRFDPNGRTMRVLREKVKQEVAPTKKPEVKPLIDFRNLQFPLSFIPKESYKVHPRHFGSNRSGGKRKHAGCDLYAPEGTPIYAMADGVIIKFSYFYYGTYELVVKHGTGVIRYGEVATVLPNKLKVGSKVKKGDQIANVGLLHFPSGNTMSMLHLEMYSGKETGNLTDKSAGANKYMRRADLIDPTTYLDRAAKVLKGTLE
ncbi:hypothetical protein A3K86_04450 [Photobacterium jeanii]|uniref:M23ase beta-sheet core domain-containing protein n=1 Tax=Photobacterium jeanii TaxID=858640 RepID=A0A178KLZ8_9GAMM|nr:M23 family metallopeptidase [Photobacterium jeanii]OAN18156.1 hypothetical protein A3K86_04450 [Photobacterium jeanii]PST92168.1 M23 family peptidase [Photobacterium jeanii]